LYTSSSCVYLFVFFVFFFFFQAEDGIRDATVTGVQTCALPIFKLGNQEFYFEKDAQLEELLARERIPNLTVTSRDGAEVKLTERSEERRVGKECRCRRGR